MNRLWRIKSGRTGFTALEALLASALLALVMLTAGRALPKMRSFTFDAMSRQQLTNEARNCLDAIRMTLSTALASTVDISTPPGDAPAYSRIRFLDAEKTAFEIAWSSNPPHSVHISRTPVGSATQDRVVAHNVTSLMFFFTDFRDPSLIRITVQTSILGPTPARSPLEAVLLANQPIQLLAH